MFNKRIVIGWSDLPSREPTIGGYRAMLLRGRSAVRRQLRATPPDHDLNCRRPMKLRTVLVAVLCLSGSFAFARDDDFKREGKGEKRAAKDELEGTIPPRLKGENWRNTDGKTLALEQFEGKVVLLDFWGVWCGPCRAAIPHLKELLREHKDDGLVVIGIHTSRQGEKMPAFVEEQEIRYPVAVDIEQEIVKAFRVDSYPDYYLIDRQGVLRFADLENKEVDRAVKLLLKE